MKTFAEVLVDLHACDGARDWVGSRSLADAWVQCECADWMLWLTRALGVADRWVCADLARLFACEALEAVGADEWAREIRALPAVTDAETAATAEFWLRFAAAYAHADASAASAYAAYAADAAADAADAADDASAANAANAAAYAHAAADAAAKLQMQRRCAALVRERIPLAALATALAQRAA